MLPEQPGTRRRGVRRCRACSSKRLYSISSILPCCMEIFKKSGGRFFWIRPEPESIMMCMWRFEEGKPPGRSHESRQGRESDDDGIEAGEGKKQEQGAARSHGTLTGGAGI
eukprot:761950-Hanusia_phi.AAC.1